MNRLRPDDVRSYIDQGFLAMPGLVTPDELDVLRADIVKIARGDYPTDAIKPVEDDVSDDDAMASILCVHMPHSVSPTMADFVAHKRIVEVLTGITGAHLPHWDGRVKCMQSMLFVKPPGLPGQAWHQDEVFIPTRDRSLLGAWIAIDDATTENGCLWVLPGSHRNGYLYPQRAHENSEEFDFAPESHGFDASDEVPVEVEAGTVVFFNGYLLHRSRKNRSDGHRRVLVNHYCNMWSLLPWAIPIERGVATADYRGIVPVAGEDPYAWRGYADKPRVGLRPYGPN